MDATTDATSHRARPIRRHRHDRDGRPCTRTCWGLTRPERGLLPTRAVAYLPVGQRREGGRENERRTPRCAPVSTARRRSSDGTPRPLGIGKIPREYRRVFAAARAAGWRIERRRGGHFALWPPDAGTPVFCASS